MESHYLQQIDSLLEVQRYDEAVRHCLKGLAQFPDSLELIEALVRSHLGNDNFAEADRASQRLIQSAPDVAFCYYLRSLVLHQRKYFDGELEMAEVAVRLDPEEPMYLYRLGQAQLQSGDIARAKETASQALRLAPDDCDSLVLVGDIEQELGKYAEAEKRFRAALKMEPENIAILNSLAICLWELNREREAIDVFFSALKRDSNDSALQSNTFELIKRYLDKATLTGKRKAAFAELPSAMQLFYTDYQKRGSIFERYSRYTLTVFWIAAIGVLAFFFSFIE